MELYEEISYQLSKQLTLKYSTSFGKSSSLFSKSIQPHIYAIYSLVRIADEIVDTYPGKDKDKFLLSLEEEAYRALELGYSTNPIVYAFALTAQKYDITKELITPFFESMRMDLSPQDYTRRKYATYIYGSAEVIGLMCLRVFTNGDTKHYEALAPGAKALGAAYQKVNFLRDIASDYHERGRVYFPGVQFETFNETVKQAIIKNIKTDFATAAPTIAALPASARKAVGLSFRYYQELLKKLEQTPAEIIKTTRIRIPDSRKLALFVAEKTRKLAQ